MTLAETYGSVAYEAHSDAVGVPAPPWCELALMDKAIWMEVGRMVAHAHLDHEREHLMLDGDDDLDDYDDFAEGAD